jgi:hypothetical protein
VGTFAGASQPVSIEIKKKNFSGNGSATSHGCVAHGGNPCREKGLVVEATQPWLVALPLLALFFFLKTIGFIPVTSVQFDPTKRARINTAIFRDLLSQQEPQPALAA